MLSCFYVTSFFSCLHFELFPVATSSIHSKDCYSDHSLVKLLLTFYQFSSPNIRSTSSKKKKKDNNSICFIFKRYGSRKWHVWSWFLASESKSISNSSLPIGLIIVLSWSDKISKKCYHSSFCLGPAVVLTCQWFL